MTRSRVPQSVLGTRHVDLGRTRIDVAARLLHHMERGALRDYLGAACMAELLHRGARLAVGINWRGSTFRKACEHNQRRSKPTVTQNERAIL